MDDNTCNRPNNSNTCSSGLYDDSNTRNRTKGSFLLILVGGSGLISGFGAALAMARKKDPQMFIKGIHGIGPKETGTSLALRALGWGTLYAVTGVTFISFAAWKFVYIDTEHFRAKLSGLLPKIPKNEPAGRSDFKTVRELVEFVSSTEDNRERR